MPWTGSPPSQTYVRTDNTRSGSAVNAQAAAASIPNSAELADNRENDFATALNLVLKRDGGNSPTADIPMNGHALTGMSQGTARDSSLRIDQVQDGDLVYAEAGGTANAITLTTSPTCSPTEGMRISFIAEADSSGAVTVNLNGNGAVALQIAASALTGGEIRNGRAVEIVHDGTVWQFANPNLPTTIANLGTVSAVDINSGTIDGTVVGGSTPAAGTFTAIVGTSLSVGTGGVATTGTIEVGHASDTTVSRASAGDIAVEGNLVYRAGGTDVPVTDGGTGASTAAGARTNLGAVLTDAVFPGALIAIIEDQKSSSTFGQNITSGGDRTRDLNTLVYNRNSAVSLSANRFTLPAGNWEISWSAPMSDNALHQSMLYDVTAGSVLKRGSSEYTNTPVTNGADTSTSTGITRVSLSGSNDYEIRHRTNQSQTGGTATSFGTETYTRVIIRAA